MTKAKTTTSSTPEQAELKTVANTHRAKVRRQRGKVAAASASGTAPSANTTLTEIPMTPAATSPAPKPPRQTKAALLRAKLAEPGGVSLAALIEATGWQAHTLRAAMSGLRKEGLTLTRRREGEDTIYAIDPIGTAVAKIAGEGALEEIAPEAPRAAMPEDRDAGPVHPAAVSHPAVANA